MNTFTLFLSRDFYSFWEYIFLGTPVSSCFPPNEAGLRKPLVVMPQGLSKYIMSHTTQNTCAKT